MSCRISSFVLIFSFLCYIFTMTDAYLPPRPTRPEKFTDKKEVKEYVEKLKEYYGIIGRGRYGKRSVYSSPDFFLRPYYYTIPLPYYALRYGSYLDFPMQHE